MKLKWTVQDRMVSYGPHTRGMRMLRVDEAKYKGYIAIITEDNTVIITTDLTTPATYGPQTVNIRVQTNGRENALDFAVSILKALEKANS